MVSERLVKTARPKSGRRRSRAVVDARLGDHELDKGFVAFFPPDPMGFLGQGLAKNVGHGLENGCGRGRIFPPPGSGAPGPKSAAMAE